MFFKRVVFVHSTCKASNGSFLWLLLPLFWLAGCQSSQDPNYQFKDYQKRLVRVLKVESVKPLDADLLKAPRKRHREITVDKSSISLFSFMKLENCPLKVTLAKKNNQLGQHMQAGNGIFYELTLRKEITYCLALQKHKSQIEHLQQVQQDKQNSKLVDLWQYTLAANWYGRFVNTATSPLQWDDKDTLLLATQALKDLNRQLSYIDNKEPVESNLKSNINHNIAMLENGEALGKLIVSMYLAKIHIEASTKTIKAVNKLVVCNRNKKGSYQPNQNMQYFNNVVVNYFAKNIQLYLVMLDKQGSQLTNEHQNLLKKFTKLNSGSYRITVNNVLNFHSEINLLRQSLKKSITKHVKAIKDIQTICD